MVLEVKNLKKYIQHDLVVTITYWICLNNMKPISDFPTADH